MFTTEAISLRGSVCIHDMWWHVHHEDRLPVTHLWRWSAEVECKREWICHRVTHHEMNQPLYDVWWVSALTLPGSSLSPTGGGSGHLSHSDPPIPGREGGEGGEGGEGEEERIRIRSQLTAQEDNSLLETSQLHQGYLWIQRPSCHHQTNHALSFGLSAGGRRRERERDEGREREERREWKRQW